jgi:GT2 family glycosyltransferase
MTRIVASVLDFRTPEPPLARVRRIETGRNGGFAFGHNAAVRAVEAEAYLLINSDTLLRAGAVERLWRRLADDPKCAVVSPRLEDPDGTSQTSCFRFHSALSELGSASSGVDAPDGALRRRPRYFYASRARYFRKHHGAGGLLAANLMWTAGRALSWTRETFGSKRPHTVAHELGDRWRA